jgi:hypothetical protein
MRFLCCLLFLLGSCARHTEYRHVSEYIPKGDIVYLSLDLSSAATFSKIEARFGPADLTVGHPIWESSPAKYITTADGVQCISIGEPESSIEFAVKRPLRRGENYICLRTKFRVVQCFYECKAVIIEMNRSLSGGRSGTYQSYMYLDNCRGALILSEANDFSKGIPVNAEWLRGEIGILAHPDYKKCRLF